MSDSLFSALLAASIHEIKNRFGLLYNDLDSLLTKLNVADTDQQRVASIKSEAQFIGSELVRILASYKSLSGSFDVAIDEQFAIDILEESIARHSYTFKVNNITANLDCDEEANGFFDRNLITIILDTLIYNAIKAKATQICLSAHEDDQYLYLQLDDNGPGFPKDMLNKKITQSAVSVDTQSTGLGLYFAQQLLNTHSNNEHSAELNLDASTRLGGALVSIKLPL